jgi:hypothetical protein
MFGIERGKSEIWAFGYFWRPPNKGVCKNGANIEFYPGFLSKIQKSRPPHTIGIDANKKFPAEILSYYRN